MSLAVDAPLAEARYQSQDSRSTSPGNLGAIVQFPFDEMSGLGISALDLIKNLARRARTNRVPC
jgi:hypothetical protein